MQPVDISLSGPLFNFSPSGSLLSTQTYPVYRKLLTAGPMIEGDKKTPLPFWYNLTNDDRWWYGRYETYYLGKLSSYSVGCMSGSSTPLHVPEWDRQWVYNDALGKLYEKIRGNLDLSISIAERRATMRMMTGTAKILRKARQVKKLGFGLGASSKALADGWLSWKYGWKPLLMDVFGAADEAIRIAEKSISRITVRATKPLQSGRKYQSTVVGPIRGDSVVKGKGFQTCRITVAYKVSDSAFDLNRWSSLNPLSLAWELTTLSFVADWFFDVGSFLRNYESALVYNQAFVSGFVSEFYTWDGVEEMQDGTFWKVGSTSYVSRGLTARTRRRNFARTVLTSMPLPHKPTVSVDLGSSQLLTSAALLRQLIKSV